MTEKCRRSWLLAGLTLALWLCVGSPIIAQNPESRGITDTRLDSVGRRVESIEPRSGPPGTKVTLHTGGMPALTPLRIGMGAVRFGFEEIGQVLTNEKGEFTLTVEVPSWARRDLVHRFIVFDFYFVPIALSDIFHVTDENGMIERTGAVASVSGPCPVLRTDDHLLYALAGDLPTLEAGQRIVVEGHPTTSRVCGGSGGGVTVQVARITPQHS
jgi:hypothetical protein